MAEVAARPARGGLPMASSGSCASPARVTVA